MGRNVDPIQRYLGFCSVRYSCRAVSDEIAAIGNRLAAFHAMSNSPSNRETVYKSKSCTVVHCKSVNQVEQCLVVSCEM
jgi:hypothetical protein